MASIHWSELSSEESTLVKEALPVSKINDLVRYDGGVVVTRGFTKIADRLRNFTVRDDDIWILTFPKCGTTWAQETVSMLINDGDPAVSSIPLALRSPFLELGAILGDTTDNISSLPPAVAQVRRDPLTYAENMTGRRVLKVHMPPEFLPPDLTERCKVIYVARDPRDVCVSYFNHYQVMPGHGYVGDFSQFAKLFQNGLLLFGDFWHHLLSGWRMRDEPNVKFLWFKDMKLNQRGVIEELSQFLDHPVTATTIDLLENHLKFDNMKNNPKVNPTTGLNLKSDFMRKGQVGDWKNFFSVEESEQWTNWIKLRAEDRELADIILKN